MFSFTVACCFYFFGIAAFPWAVPCAADDVDEERVPLPGLGAIEPYDLRVEHLVNPLGIDTPKPRFTWKLKSQENGQRQQACVLELYKIVNQAPTELIWTGGNIAGYAAQEMIYDGKPLEPGTEYAWFLTVWDKPRQRHAVLTEPPSNTLPTALPELQAAATSLPSTKVGATFTTGLFATEKEPNPWKGKWIGLDTPPESVAGITLAGAKWIAASPASEGFNLPVGKSVFRKTFEAPEAEELVKAELAFAADNAHRAFVNGTEVKGGGSFKSARVVEITELVKPGKNVIAVEVNNAGETPNPGGMVGVVTVTAKRDTLSLRMTTNADWKAAEGTPENFADPALDDSGWAAAREQCKVGEGPWGEVSCAAEPPSLPARYLRKAFTPEKPEEIVRATAYVSGLGYYELYLNGEKVGDHKLDPVLTWYDKRVPYVTYEIDPKKLVKYVMGDAKGRMLPARQSDLGVVLGNGRYYAPRINDPTKTLTFGYPKLLFQLDIIYKDGTKKSIVSDESWEITTDGPIRENNDYDGEIYDSRKELRGWKNAWHYSDHEGTWQAAELVEPPKGKLVAQMMPPMRAVEEFQPQSVTEVKPGVWVFDFGVNLVGHCRLLLPPRDRMKQGTVAQMDEANRIPPGTEILLRHAETLQTAGSDKGMLYTANLRGAKCRDVYIAYGSYRPGGNKANLLDTEIYEPTFTYHGFRYAEITGLPEDYKPTVQTLTALAINTDLPRASSFETSNETINAVYRNIVRGTQGNYLSIPTDCPQRDERQGWQGDRAGEAQGEMYLFDNVAMYMKWLDDIEDSQRDDGNLSDVCPPFWPLYNSNVTWPSAFTIIPETIFTMYGDRRPIERHYAAMKRWLLDHLGTFVTDGLIAKDNYGDWCVPPEEKTLIHSQDPARRTDKTLLATAYYIHNLRLLEKYARMLDKPEEASGHAKRADEMTAAFNKRFYNAEAGRYDNGTQTSCVLPLRFGLVPQGDESKVFQTLVANIENVTKMHIGTGLIGGQWLNRVLTDFGRSDIAYTFATNRDYPSWGYMVEKGATTIWELWNGDTADPAMNSGNHVMLVGDLGIWYFETLAGIKADPEKPGFAHIIMKPQPQQGLTFVNATYDSPRGPIASRWEHDPATKTFTWEIEIPCGSTATVTVPTGDASGIRCDGQVRQIAPGVYEVPSGEYTFTATL